MLVDAASITQPVNYANVSTSVGLIRENLPVAHLAGTRNTQTEKYRNSKKTEKYAGRRFTTRVPG